MVPFRAARSSCDDRCRHFNCVTRITCRLAPKGSATFRTLKMWSNDLKSSLVRFTIVIQIRDLSGSILLVGKAAHTISYLAASRSHTVIHQLNRQLRSGLTPLVGQLLVYLHWSRPPIPQGKSVLSPGDITDIDSLFCCFVFLAVSALPLRIFTHEKRNFSQRPSRHEFGFMTNTLDGSGRITFARFLPAEIKMH